MCFKNPNLCKSCPQVGQAIILSITQGSRHPVGKHPLPTDPQTPDTASSLSKEFSSPCPYQYGSSNTSFSSDRNQWSKGHFTHPLPFGQLFQKPWKVEENDSCSEDLQQHVHHVFMLQALKEPCLAVPAALDCGSLQKLKKARFLQMKGVLKPPAANLVLDLQCRMQKCEKEHREQAARSLSAPQLRLMFPSVT